MAKVTLCKVRTCLLLLVISSLASACSTVVEGRSQRIMIDSDPEGAYCVIRSNDMVVATIPSTPQAIVLEKSKYDLVAECTKDGYYKSKGRARSEYAISTLGNMVFGQFGMVGSVLDTMSGASNKYESQLFVSLERATAVPVTVAASASTPVVSMAAPTPVITERPAMPQIIVLAPQSSQPTRVVGTIQVADAPVEPTAAARVLQPPFE